MAAPTGGGDVVNIVGGGQFPKILAKSFDDFEVGVTLGTGSFGRVRFATHKVCCCCCFFTDIFRKLQLNGQSKS